MERVAIRGVSTNFDLLQARGIGGRFKGSGFIGIGVIAEGDSLNVNGLGLLGAGNTGVWGKGSTGVKGGSFETGDLRSEVGVEGQSAGGIGVRGIALDAPSGLHYGGYFDATDGTLGCGVYAEGSDIGLWATGNHRAAVFYGDVDIYTTSGELAISLDSGLDYAEGFDIVGGKEIEPGTVMALDPENPGLLTISTEEYDRKVAGVVAGANGLGSGVTLGGTDFDCNIALAGRIYCKVFDPDHNIEAGDLLTTSDQDGYACKAVDWKRSQGAVLGKAMESLARGKQGTILVMITLQ